ncbi:MAG: glycosyltransferase [Liquorilactobacillus nagelii]|uniref:glycosyltransferase n=1 Tax=Liquorilactobacillus nagelii TaxID=82688 RepID=UPI0039EA9455
MNDLTQQTKIRDFVRMNQRPYTTTLTISLLVSNSITTIRNCMESLQPLLSEVPSELIIVDTVGPENSDGSLAIAKKYADKVVHFKWCNDFAAARNAGLKEAHGKWFMFLDDDEWFDDTSELVDFFCDENEQKKYFSLAYKIHNYTDNTGENFKLTNSTRCSRLWLNSKFIDAVHENLSPTYSPTKYVNSFVHHYGYAVDNNNGKSDRNIKILKKILANDPQNMHAWIQFIAGFSRDTHSKREKIIYYGQLALLNFKNKKHKSTGDDTYASAILGYMLQCYSIEKKWESVILLSKKTLPYLNLRNYDLCLIDALVFNALVQKNQLENSLDIFEEYLINFLHLKDNAEIISRQFTPFLSEFVSYKMLFSMTSIIINYYAENNLWTRIEKLSIDLPLSDDLNYSSSVIYSFLKVAVESKKTVILSNLFRQSKNSVNKEYLISLEQLINQLQNSLPQNKLESFNNLLLDMDYSHKFPYLTLKKAILLADDQSLAELRTQKLSCKPPFEDLLLLYINQKLDPDEIVASLNYKELSSLVSFVSDKYSRKINQIPDFISKVEKCWKECPQRDLLLITLRRDYIFSNQVILDDVKKQLQPYIANVLAFAHSFYKDKLFTNKPSIFLPTEFQFALYLKRALAALDAGKQADYFASLKTALNIYHPANSLIKRLITNFDIQQKKDAQNQEEFEQLATQIKIKIRALIAAGQSQTALPLLKSLVELVPGDSEVINLLQQIDK